MQAPKIPDDPNLAVQQQQAQQDKITTLQGQALNDTATIMARYGTRLALGGSGNVDPSTVPGSPTYVAPSAP